MNILLQAFFYLQHVIVSLLSVAGLPVKVTLALANFSLGVIGLSLLLFFPKVVVVVAFGLLLFALLRP